MQVKDIAKTGCEADDSVVVRIFANGQYLVTCKIVEAYRQDRALVIDADIEVFEMEKK